MAEVYTDEQLQEIVDAESDAQILLLPVGEVLRVTQANAAARTLLGRSSLLPDLHGVTNCCRSVWAEGAPVNLSNVLWPDNQRWYDVRVRRLYGRVSVTLCDVTDRHQGLDALLDSQTRYRVLAENAGDLVFQIHGRRVEWVSSSVRDVLGWDQSDIIGQRVMDLIHPDDRERAKAVCEGAHGKRFEARFTGRKGTWVTLSVLMRPVTDSAGSVVRIGSARLVLDQDADC